MYPFKRFVKGPNLHEESIARNIDKTTPTEGTILSGEEAKKVYEEIISIPSTEINPTQTSKSTSRALIQRRPQTPPKPSRPKLTFNQLLRLCESNNHEELQAYLEEYYNETDMDERDDYGWTMLMSAACAGSNNCVTLLLQAGVNWQLCDKKGLNAFLLAKQKGKKETCKILNDWREFCENPESSYYRQDTDNCDQDINVSSEPVYCEACEMNFSNQKEHLKSIAHLVTSGVMKTDGKVHYGIPESNKGFQMMLKTGWNKNSGLGPEGSGQKFPVKTVLKRDREGVGNEKDKKAARITHFGPFDPAAVENPERLERTATVQKREEVKRQSRERRKEINLRRELGSL